MTPNTQTNNRRAELERKRLERLERQRMEQEEAEAEAEELRKLVEEEAMAQEALEAVRKQAEAVGELREAAEAAEGQVLSGEAKQGAEESRESAEGAGAAMEVDGGPAEAAEKADGNGEAENTAGETADEWVWDEEKEMFARKGREDQGARELQAEDRDMIVVRHRKTRDAEEQPGWSEADEACVACQNAARECMVDVDAIRKWREDVRKGKVVGQAPASTSCQACLAGKRLCNLPATAAMREAMKKRKREMKGLAEDEGVERKAKRAKRKVKEAAEEGRKAPEASGSRSEPAEEVVDAGEDGGSQARPAEAGGIQWELASEKELLYHQVRVTVEVVREMRKQTELLERVAVAVEELAGKGKE